MRYNGFGLMTTSLEYMRRLVKWIPPAAVLFFMPLELSARQKSFSPRDVAELSAQASAGDPKAMDRILRAYRSHRKREKKGLLTLYERETLEKLVETLRTLSPGALAPEQKPPFAVAAGTDSERDFTAYFSFGRGEEIRFAGKSKKSIFEQAWQDNGNVWKRHVIQQTVRKDEGTRTMVLDEIFTKGGDWLAEQSFVTYQVSQKGVSVQRDVVFRQPEPGGFARVGRQEPFWLARFPLKVGNRSGGLTVTSLSDGKVRFSGPVEELTFSTGTGLASRVIFDERWDVSDSSRSAPGEDALGPLSPRDLKLLASAIRSFCKKQGLKFRSLLSAEPSGPVPEEESARARFLVFKPDPFDPAQKRYEVVTQEWRKAVFEGKTLWGRKE